MALKVRLLGNDYWFLGESLDDAGAIAPLDHCDEAGEIADAGTALFAESFAHYFPDEGVMRFKVKIADREDIEIIRKPDR